MLQFRYTDFWVTSNVFLARLYRSPLVTVAAIKGACPAGGCCLSLCCDLRVMTQQVHICAALTTLRYKATWTTQTICTEAFGAKCRVD